MLWQLTDGNKSLLSTENEESRKFMQKIQMNLDDSSIRYFQQQRKKKRKTHFELFVNNSYKNELQKI